MNVGDLGSIGEFVSSIAVLISLVYLSIQIRSNSKETRLGNVQHLFDSQKEMMLEAMNHTELLRRANEKPDSLSHDEYSRFMLFRMANLRVVETAFILYEQHSLDEEFFDLFRRRAIMILRENPELLDSGHYTEPFKKWLQQLDLEEEVMQMPYVPRKEGT